MQKRCSLDAPAPFQLVHCTPGCGDVLSNKASELQHTPQMMRHDDKAGVHTVSLLFEHVVKRNLEVM